MILVIDNYDSFTYNLVQALGSLGAELKVFRNDKITVDEADRLRPHRVIISPGPCTPKEGGVSNEIIKHFAGRVPVLGVCLGHQCIAYAFGGRVVNAPRLMHGKTSMIHHDGKTIYENIPDPFEATRYHSLAVERESLPECFDVVAGTDQDEIMGIRHKEFTVEGVQFHPESFLTVEGPEILANYLRIKGGTWEK